jgi:hypothetical protein
LKSSDKQRRTALSIIGAVGLGLGCVVVAGAVTPPLSFAPFVDIQLGPNGCTDNCSDAPLDLVAGDFNHDGKLDVATANNESDDITVLLGNGSSGLTPTTTLAAGMSPSAIAAGNLNGDTVLDLVVAAEVSGSIFVFLGNGNATFADPVEYPMGVSPESVVLADFNGDGKLDVATADLFGDGTVSVRLGAGDGTFGALMQTTLGGGPYRLAVGNLDAGTTLDLVVSLYDDSQIVPLLGNGDGTFTIGERVDVDDSPRGVALADFNNDGKLDLAVAAEGDDLVDILLGNGNGGFDLPTPYAVGGLPESVVVGDFNADGIIDVASADSFGVGTFDGSVSVLLGNGNGTFADAQQFEAGAGAFGLIAADLNGDRLPDLVTANIDDTTVSVLANTGMAPAPSCVGDCNGNGTVAINELILGVNIALGNTPLSACTAFDANGDGRVTINELIVAVNNALNGCPPA